MVDDTQPQLSWAEFHQKTRELQQDFEQRISQLEHALETARVVNTAIGIILVKFRMTQEDAQNVLNQSARSQKRKLIDLAQEQIRAAEAVISQPLRK